MLPFSFLATKNAFDSEPFISIYGRGISIWWIKSILKLFLNFCLVFSLLLLSQHKIFKKLSVFFLLGFFVFSLLPLYDYPSYFFNPENFIFLLNVISNCTFWLISAILVYKFFEDNINVLLFKVVISITAIIDFFVLYSVYSDKHLLDYYSLNPLFHFEIIFIILKIILIINIKNGTENK